MEVSGFVRPLAANADWRSQAVPSATGPATRYVTSLVVIPLIPLVMVVALHIAGIGLAELAIIPVPVMCLFLSWSVHNDVAFDNTAIWMHLAASTSGRAETVAFRPRSLSGCR